MLGTNLSVKFGSDMQDWTTETDRLLMADVEEFDELGLGMDDLVDGYVQTVLAVIAIDKLCRKLMDGGHFDRQLFATLNPDNVLLNELFIA